MAKLLILSACVIALGAACGGDDEGDSNAGAGAGTTGGSSGTTGGSSGTTGGSSGTSGGSGGSSGTSGNGSGGGGGSGGSAGPVMCGGETCPTPSNTRLSACCVTATDECGEKFTGFGSCAVPVEPHPECESATIRNFDVPSCCTAEGRCGLSAPMFGFDCLSNEEILELAAGDGGTADGGAADGGMPNPIAENIGPCTPLED